MGTETELSLDEGLVVNRIDLPIYISEGDNFHVTPLLSKLNAPGANIFVAYTIVKPGTKIPTHDHGDAWEGLYLISGGGKFTIKDKTYRASPGSFVYFPAHTPHSFINDLDENIVQIQLYSPAGTWSDMRFFDWPTWADQMQKAPSGNVLK